MDIKGFFGDHRFLSNFWPSPVELDGVTYPTVEHAYQAAKFPESVRELILREASPSAAKRLSRRWSEHVRPDWDDVKNNTMLSLLRQKFAIPELRDQLLATGDGYLEETNTWGDVYWGVCDGEGVNHLGQLLMQVRDEVSPRCPACNDAPEHYHQFCDVCGSCYDREDPCLYH